MKTKKICFYISGHGFGHTTRSLQIIKALLGIIPELQVFLKTSTPKWFVDYNLSDRRLHYIYQENDIGVVQADSLHFKPEDTFKACREFWKGKNHLVKKEVSWIAREKIDLILADIPFTAFQISSRAGIPGVGITNFSWDWIYEPFLENYPEYRYLVEEIKDNYRLSDLLYRLPFYGDLSVFSRIIDVPLVARRSLKSREETRRILGLPLDMKLILCSFGGIGIQQTITFANQSFGIFSTVEKLPRTPHTWKIPLKKMRENSLHYQDLVAAADAVLTKLGYGIVSEAVANRTPLLYIDSSDFREFPVMERGVSKLLPVLPVTRTEIYEGGWEKKAEELLNREISQEPPPLNGDLIIARSLIKRFL